MVDGEFSVVASFEMGSPKGSILSPILFACFKDVCEYILNCKFHLYPDDLQFSCIQLTLEEM
jgi:hypothetical protein